MLRMSKIQATDRDTVIWQKWEHEGVPPFFLQEGRLGTSKRQGNHDNQATNLGNQPSILTVWARQVAKQGLISTGWKERDSLIKPTAVYI